MNKTRWQVIMSAAEDIDQLNYFLSIEQKKDIKAIWEYHKCLNVMIIDNLLWGNDEKALAFIQEMYRSIKAADRYIETWSDMKCQ